MLTYTLKKGSNAAVDIRTAYGVHVEKSTGLIGKPSLKSVDSFDWKYLHGTTPDLMNRRFQSKEIKLSCWMQAESKQQLVERFNNFVNYFDYDNLIFMKVMWPTDNNNGGVMPNPHTAKGLFSLVWLQSVNVTEFKWRYGKQVVKFELNLVDPYPVKRVYKLQGEDGDGVNYDIISDTEFDIFTDQGHEVYDVLTGSGTIDCGLNAVILVCGDVAHAKSNNFDYTQADPEVPVDLTDPTTYVVTRYNFITPISGHDVVTEIYSEI